MSINQLARRDRCEKCNYKLTLQYNILFWKQSFNEQKVHLIFASFEFTHFCFSRKSNFTFSSKKSQENTAVNMTQVKKKMQTLFFPLQIMYSRSFVALEVIPSHHSAPAHTFLMSPLSPSLGDIKNASAQNNLCPLKIIIFWSTWSILFKLNGRYFFKKPIEEGKISQLPLKKKKKKVFTSYVVVSLSTYKSLPGQSHNSIKYQAH